MGCIASAASRQRVSQSASVGALPLAMDEGWPVCVPRSRSSQRWLLLHGQPMRPSVVAFIAALPIVCLFITFCILLQNIRHHRDSERRAEQEAEERQAKKRAKESKEATPQPVSAARLEGLKPTMTTLTVVVRE